MFRLQQTSQILLVLFCTICLTFEYGPQFQLLLFNFACKWLPNFALDGKICTPIFYFCQKVACHIATIEIKFNLWFFPYQTMSTLYKTLQIAQNCQRQKIVWNLPFQICRGRNLFEICLFRIERTNNLIKYLTFEIFDVKL